MQPSPVGAIDLSIANLHDCVMQGMKVSLATGGKVTELAESAGWGGDGVSYQLDLDIADALILR